ncbi:hypothetical protein DO021_00255 [Desulfobacter hydrogenophilus]|uniref:Lipoprotein n=1 Tax=Desulfobacter hydrogenophilus TaxID=2291 RepID=A0A328FLP5_9BACT|nr:GNA1162 family protein [Desulfobacter hydrogenophilus]NDY72283.1 hypothetical protein [Desulfobacter hydrogenophilus]QBH12910.1 hypothetical protein EYB58_08270 [Desulfobacter hydrogenophilus]RAM03895.1 hypothetical protein DO021_00255 [Desulfobacter hydrogenophilus]
MSTSIRLHHLFFLFIILITSGCTTTPYDYTAFEKSKPRSIVVIPPNNNSIEVNAPYIYLSTLTRPLAEKGYYVFPVFVIDHFLKENGLPTPAEMNGIPLDKIGEHIGADAVLYISIEDWGQKYQILQSVTKVHATLRLVDVKTGDFLWESIAIAQQSSGDGGGGLVGALVGAVVTQVLSSTIVDPTPDLARQANNMAIYSQLRGMLDGPYKRSTEKE